MTTITTFRRGRLMDFTALPAIITAASGVLVSFGFGAKWLLNRMDVKDRSDRDWQEAERKKLEALFSNRIDSLERQILGQDGEIHRMRVELTSYVRHVGVLEGLLKANGIEAPTFIKIL